MGNKTRVAILFGGRSAEHEVSLQSARNVLDAIDAGKYETVLIGIDRDGAWFLNKDSISLLNADDPLCLKMAAYSDAENLCYVTMNPRHPLVRRAALNSLRFAKITVHEMIETSNNSNITN